jgi:hypothetical protein
MAEISYRRHRFPPVIIQHAVWVYLRVTLSYRDDEELLLRDINKSESSNRSPLSRGTESSNPSPSSAESVANLTFGAIERPKVRIQPRSKVLPT